MDRRTFKLIGLASSVLAVALNASSQMQAQSKNPYPSMAALNEYLISDRNAEIALARSAAPDSISHDAKVLVLGRHGYETAVEGKNGFVCVVERGWMGPFEGELSANFWNPNFEVRSASIRRLPAPSCRLLTKERKWYWRVNPKLRSSTASRNS